MLGKSIYRIVRVSVKSLACVRNFSNGTSKLSRLYLLTDYRGNKVTHFSDSNDENLRWLSSLSAAGSLFPLADTVLRSRYPRTLFFYAQESSSSSFLATMGKAAYVQQKTCLTCGRARHESNYE